MTNPDPNDSGEPAPDQDARHRAVALDLLMSGKASQDLLAQAVELVRKRREGGNDAQLLPVLVGLGVLTSEEAEEALARLDAGAIEITPEAAAGEKGWWESGEGPTDEAQEAEPIEPEAEPTEAEPEAEATEPEAEATEPEAEATEPEAEATEPEAEATEPEAETTEPEAEVESPAPQPAPETGTAPKADSTEVATPPAVGSAEKGWWESDTGSTRTGGPTETSSSRVKSSISARDRFQEPRSAAPAALGVIGIAAVIGVTWFALRGGGAAESPSASPSPTPTEIAEARPILVAVPQAEQVLSELADEGRFELALELLETCDPTLLELGKDVFPAQEELLRRGLALSKELEEALSEGADSVRLKERVLQAENYELDPDLQRLGFVALFLARAKRVLGEKSYQDLVLYGLQVAEGPTGGDDEDEIELLDRSVAEIKTRGNESRRARFAQEALAAAARVKVARAAISERATASKQQFRVEAERALADSRPIEVPAWRGEEGWRGRLLGYTERSFVLSGPRGRRRFTWIDAPPATALDVLERGVDGEDADGLYRLARRAATGALFFRARQYVDRLQAVDPTYPVPDLSALEPVGRLFQASGTASVDSVDLVYDFDDELQGSDWVGLGTAQVEVREGTLALRPLRELGVFTAVAGNPGRFSQLTCRVTPAHISSRVLVGVGEHYVRCGTDGVSLATWGDGSAPPESSADRPGLDTTQPFSVVVRTGHDDFYRVQVKQGGKVLLAEVIEEPRGLAVLLGAEGGEARLDEVRLTGKPIASWFRSASDSIPFTLEQLIEEWELTAGPRASGTLNMLPARFAKTSAEDEVGLEGIPEGAREQVAHARRWLEMGAYSAAARYLRQAISQGRSSYWAAEYLLGLCELEEAAHGDNLAGERIRLEQALLGVEDFYEALAARSVLQLQEGHLLAARADAERALELRPDYAPAHMALAWVDVQEGDLAGAVERAHLAFELSGDLDTMREAARIEALSDGPSWSEATRQESEHYVVWTDMPDRLAGFVQDLESLRGLAPQALPTLSSREGARQRKGEVFIFGRAEDFYRYAHRTLGRRGENLAGVFDPRSGQLLLFESSEGAEQTRLVLRHEATHQWIHSLGLALPYWVNEAVATYLAGVEVDPRGGLRTVDWDEQEIEVLQVAEASWTPLFELMTMSPAEFYSGYTYLNYAQAWSFVHYCMEGGDGELRGVFLDYLGRHSEGRAGDKSSLMGVKLEHLYAETFLQLDMERVEAGWAKHVKGRLARVLEER